MPNSPGRSQSEIFESYDGQWIHLQGTNGKLVITREEAEKRNLAVNQQNRKQLLPVINPPFALFDEAGNMFPVSVASLNHSHFSCFLTSLANGAQGDVGSVFQILNPGQRVGMLECFVVTFQNAATADSSELGFQVAFGDRIQELKLLAANTTSANMQAFNAAMGILCNDIAKHYPRISMRAVTVQPFRPSILNLPTVRDYSGDGSPIIGLGRPMTDAIKKMNDGRSQMPNGANKTQPIKPKKRRIDHS